MEESVNVGVWMKEDSNRVRNFGPYVPHRRVDKKDNRRDERRLEFETKTFVTGYRH
jgi:hypothetical protein